MRKGVKNKNINNNFIDKIIKNKFKITNKDYIDFINILINKELYK